VSTDELQKHLIAALKYITELEQQLEAAYRVIGERVVKGSREEESCLVLMKQ
jgi:hypothetical protein